MKKLHLLIIAILLLAGFGVSTKTVSAGPISIPTCNSVTFAGTTDGGGGFIVTRNLLDFSNGNTVVGSATVNYAAGIDPNSPVTGSGTYNAPVGDTIGLSIYFEWVVPPCTGGGSNAITFCNLSADGRLDGKCGDRIALYCNTSATPPNLDVWVIDTTSVGHELVKLPLTSLVPTFTKNLGVNGILNGGSDASGNGWIALSGGPYGGTGSGDWAKTFTCSAG